MEERGIIECSKLYPALCFDMHGSPGFHNVYVGLLVICSGIWMLYRLSKIIEFYEMVRIIQEGKVINIPSLGPYASELKKLARVHISQIIREKCSISPTAVKKVHVTSILEESTLKTRLIPNPSSSSNPDESYSLEVSFKVDSMVPYSVQLFWGVDFFGAKEMFNTERGGGDSRKGVDIVGGKDSRMALGSGMAMYENLKCREGLFNQKMTQRECELGRITSINESDSSLEKSRGVFESMQVENSGNDFVDLNGSYPLDFSPSESIKSIAYANPILFTAEMASRNDPLRSVGGIVESHFDSLNNLSGREGQSVGSKITRAIRKMKDGLGKNALTEYIGDSLNYSGWNSSLLGDNAIVLGKAVKRMFEKVFFYDLAFPNHNGNANYMNSSVMGGHVRLNLTASSLISSASATTESLLESSRNGVQHQSGCRYKSGRDNGYSASLNSRLNIDGIKDQRLIDRLDAMHTTEKKYFEKGLSQEFCERIRLTPEYLSLCNLYSPYDDTCDRDHDHGIDNKIGTGIGTGLDNYFFNGDYFEIQQMCDKDKNSVWSRRFFENDGNSESVLIKNASNEENASGASKKNMTRVPLLILIRADVGAIQDESVLTNHIVVVHFDLIQDHYNIPYLMYKPLILKQAVSNSFGHLIEPYDIFGMEDDELDCLICMSNPKDVILLPCRHCISCESCLRSLRQDKCPLCRTTFYGFAVLPIKSS